MSCEIIGSFKRLYLEGDPDYDAAGAKAQKIWETEGRLESLSSQFSGEPLEGRRKVLGERIRSILESDAKECGIAQEDVERVCGMLNSEEDRRSIAAQIKAICQKLEEQRRLLS